MRLSEPILHTNLVHLRDHLLYIFRCGLMRRLLIIIHLLQLEEHRLDQEE